MDPAFARRAVAMTPSFTDGLGDRTVFTDPSTGDLVEMLALRPELTAVPAFEFALRERASRLANFRHAYYARVRRIDRMPEADGRLAIVYDHTPGARLSDILHVAERDKLALDINAALCLVRQLVPAVATLHQNARDVAHGAIGSERIVVTPHARLVIVEYVLGAALEQLRYSHERLWRELRVAMPSSAGLPRFDHRADVTQVGMVALSLVLGRCLREDEFPRRVAEVLASAHEVSNLGGRAALGGALRDWLARALQLDYRRSFHSTVEAMNALDDVLSDGGNYIAAPVALEAFLARYEACAARPVEAAEPQKPDPVSSWPEPVAFRPDPVAPKPEPVAVRPAATTKTEPVEARTDDASARRRITPPAEPVHRETAEPIRPFDTLGLDAAPAPAPTPAGRGPLDPTRREARPAREPVESARREPVEPARREPVEAAESQAAEPSRWRRMRRFAVAALVLLAVGEAAFIGLSMRATSVTPSREGMLVIDTRPAGAEVIVDGKVRGVSPLMLALPPGAHTLEVKGDGEPRVIPLTMQAGVQTKHYIELTGAPPTGALEVQTEPPGARVSIDGQMRGIAPLTVGDLTPGPHEIVVDSNLGTSRQKVTIEAGATGSLVVPLAAPPAPVSGWVAVSAPVEMEIFENGRLLGTTQTDRIMMSAGRHELQIVSETLAYRVTKVVQVPVGRVQSVRIDLPMGTVDLNALPWAEVWIDGQKVGDTPIGNLAVPIGPHEIVFRHPQFGERRHAATVTLGGSTRLSVDLRK